MICDCERNKRILKALRALHEAVCDHDGRSGEAQEHIDYLAARLSDLYQYDFKEGESVFE